MSRRSINIKYLFLLIILPAGIFFLLRPSVSQAAERCCVRGPGDCSQLLNDDLSQCPGGGQLRNEPCRTIDRCSEKPATTVLCCMCPSAAGENASGSCFLPQTQEAPCGTGTVPCYQSAKACSDEDLCKKWYQPVEEKEATQKLAYFIPSVTIPFSDKFNKGEKIVLTGETLGEYIAALYFFFCSIAAILATVMMMYGGIRYVTSFGNPQLISKAKESITSAMLGLAIALGAYVILLTINPNLVTFKGLTGVSKITPVPELERQESSVKGSPAVIWDGRNVSKYDQLLTTAANVTTPGMDRNWLKAIMLVESAGRADAVSPAGACGLMQLMPTTAAIFSPGITCSQLLDANTNVMIAAKYYQSLWKLTCPPHAYYKNGQEANCLVHKTNCTNGDPYYISAAYNGGVGANCASVDCPGKTWWECEVNVGYAETRSYVQRVHQAYVKIVGDPKNNIAPDPSFAWTVSST